MPNLVCYWIRDNLIDAMLFIDSKRNNWSIFDDNGTHRGID